MLTEEDRRKDIDKANSYKQMFDLWAWKDFETYLDELKIRTVNDFISFQEDQAVEFKAGQFKGILDCLTKIQKQLDYIVSEK